MNDPSERIKILKEDYLPKELSNFFIGKKKPPSEEQ